MSNPTVRIRYGDTYPFAFRITRKDPENVDMEIPVNLTNCDIYFTMRDHHTKESIIDMGICDVKGDPDNGWVQFVFPSIEIPRGMYETWFTVVDEDNSVCSYPLCDMQMIHVL